jgi:cob(I)alamin adenosyltransferase
MKQMNAGLIQVYTGEGKGKTTAALGLVTRALGQGQRVLLVRFLKADEPPSGEILFLRQTPNLDILTSGLSGLRADLEAQALRDNIAQTFREVQRRLHSQGYDLVVLDEINGVLHRGLLELDRFLKFLDERPAATELVLTGRNALPEIVERAHLVSRIEKIKHPFDQGIGARRGMEY